MIHNNHTLQSPSCLTRVMLQKTVLCGPLFARTPCHPYKTQATGQFWGYMISFVQPNLPCADAEIYIMGTLKSLERVIVNKLSKICLNVRAYHIVFPSSMTVPCLHWVLRDTQSQAVILLALKEILKLGHVRDMIRHSQVCQLTNIPVKVVMRDPVQMWYNVCIYILDNF